MMRIFVLNGKSMTSREEAYAVIARKLHFPEWFGKNLDALADCLAELRSGSVILFRNTGALTEQLGEYGEKLLACFRDCTRETSVRLIEKN